MYNRQQGPHGGPPRPWDATQRDRFGLGRHSHPLRWWRSDALSPSYGLGTSTRISWRTQFQATFRRAEFAEWRRYYRLCWPIDMVAVEGTSQWKEGQASHWGPARAQPWCIFWCFRTSPAYRFSQERRCRIMVDEPHWQFGRWVLVHHGHLWGPFQSSSNCSSPASLRPARGLMAGSKIGHHWIVDGRTWPWASLPGLLPRRDAPSHSPLWSPLCVARDHSPPIGYDGRETQTVPTASPTSHPWGRCTGRFQSSCRAPSLAAWRHLQRDSRSCWSIEQNSTQGLFADQSSPFSER